MKAPISQPPTRTLNDPARDLSPLHGNFGDAASDKIGQPIAAADHQSRHADRGILPEDDGQDNKGNPIIQRTAQDLARVPCTGHSLQRTKIGPVPI